MLSKSLSCHWYALDLPIKLSHVVAFKLFESAIVSSYRRSQISLQLFFPISIVQN